MLIQDLRFIEETNGTDQIHGGVSAFTGVTVGASGSNAYVDSSAGAYGKSTNAATTGITYAATDNKYYALSTATGTGVSYAVTVDGKDSKVATSVSTGVATDVKLF
ncbi:MAG: hypothetical protein ACRC1Z_04120 [Waterburya sp.]